MTADRYRLAPIFGVRPAGVAFDVLDRLGTPAVAEAGRRVMALEAEAGRAAGELLARLPDLVPGDRSRRDWLKRALKRGAEIPPERLAEHPWLAPCDRAVRRLRAASAELEALIGREYDHLHARLVRDAARELPDFLVIESEALADELERLTGATGATGAGSSPAPSPDPSGAPSAGHTGRDRETARSLALYLQRVCAKNDTVSRFGPCAWGTIVPGEGVDLRPRAGVARRRVEIERWVVKDVIGLMNADPDVRPEAPPRLHPHGRLEGDGFARLDEDRELPLSDEERAVAGRCDGRTPAYRLGGAPVLEHLEQLALRGVIRWEVEPMAVDASPLASLQGDVSGWREGPARDRWGGRLAAIAELARRFGADPSAAGRRGIVTELRAYLEALGLDRRDRPRTLYAARNPISENCLQDGVFTLGARAAEAMVADAWPWFELFRDAVALAAARAFGRLHEVIAAAPRRHGSLGYSTLARVARQHGLSLENDHWHTQVGGEVFGDIKRELTELLGRRPDAPEWRLTAEECTFLRRRHRLPPDGELSYASADLQVAAASAEDAAAGRLEWLVAELHFAPVLLQHALHWSCPDPSALAADMARVVGPLCLRDAFGEAPVHSCGEALTRLPGAVYAGTGRPKPGWRAVRPADAEVVVDEERCDVRLRAAGSGEDLGSIIRTVRLVAGLHPFFPFERGPHAPRLRVGDVIVQRRTWHVDSATIGEPRPSGVSAAFVAGLERERADRGIPRWVFLRPAPDVLRTHNVFARHKDNKPFYVDLESVVFLDILERRLRKYGTLVFTEMLPSPDQLCWSQPEGRFTFEVRTNLVPPAAAPAPR